LRAQIYLGDEAFVQRMQSHVDASERPEVPRVQRRRQPRPLNWYLGRGDRDEAIALAHLVGGYTLTAISQATNLSISRISRLIGAHEAKGKT